MGHRGSSRLLINTSANLLIALFWLNQHQPTYATVEELPDEAAAAAFLSGAIEACNNMSIPIGSALGSGGLPFDMSLPPHLQTYSRQVMSQPVNSFINGPASVVNPFTGALPAAASQTPAPAPARPIVRMPINMEIERNRAAAGE